MSILVDENTSFIIQGMTGLGGIREALVVRGERSDRTVSMSEAARRGTEAGSGIGS